MRKASEIADQRLTKNGDSYTLMLGDSTVYNIPEDVADLLHDAMKKAVESDRAQREPAYATATDWEVSKLSDDAGEWVYLQVYDPAIPEQHEIVHAPVVNVSLSDHEAKMLAKGLLPDGGTLVVIAHRQTWADDDLTEVLDLDALFQAPGEWSAEDVAVILSKLRRHGWESIAEEVEEVWNEHRDEQQ